ncbi:MAG TPA: HD domain-containing protein [Clostridia bacterium]|nr:HD domain-containing protein [Clostridia bacterium]
MNFPSESIEVLEKLNFAGHKAYFVGGSLRDSLLGKAISDIDLATSAHPDEVMELFSDHTIYPIGLKHGTLTLIYKKFPLEITTFRTEGEYEKHRRPKSVRFSTSIEEDVQRRDFTINALAYHPKEGLLDFVGGQEDLDKQILRTVGPPKDRFNEDALRMMRGLRFLASLGFSLDKKSKDALFELKHLLKEVSPQRLKKELNLLLMGDYAEDVLIKYYEILGVFLPEILPMVDFEQQTPYHCYDVWTHTAKVVTYSKKDQAHRLAALFHDIEKPSTFYLDERDIGHFPGHGIESAKTTKTILTRLGYSNKMQKNVLPMILHHNSSIYPEIESIARRIFYWGPKTFFDVLDLKRADNLAKEPAFIRSEKAYQEVEDMAKDYLANKPLLSYKDLDISSEQLMEMGYTGKKLGFVLEKLIMAVFAGLANEKEALVDYLLQNK